MHYFIADVCIQSLYNTKLFNLPSSTESTWTVVSSLPSLGMQRAFWHCLTVLCNKCFDNLQQYTFSALCEGCIKTRITIKDKSSGEKPLLQPQRRAKSTPNYTHPQKEMIQKQILQVTFSALCEHCIKTRIAKKNWSCGEKLSLQPWRRTKSTPTYTWPTLTNKTTAEMTDGEVASTTNH